VRATAIELEPLAREESEELVDALLAEQELPLDVRSELLEKTEGNPLFVEETIRMLSEGGGDPAVRLPDTVQALIAARIDRLPVAGKLLLQRAAVIGRIFWASALGHLSPDVDDVDAQLDDLLLRDFVLQEPRSSISGERALRFKHVLIREVAYAGLPKSGRAEHHKRFAEWLRERTGEELLEILAYHLDQAARLTAELDGAVPDDLRRDAAAALTEAGMRALAREANRSARTLLLRAAELEPTLDRRHKAAVAAWRMDDLPAVAAEMEEVAADARVAGDDRIFGRALNALAHVALLRDGDLPRASELAEQALTVLGDDVHGRSDTLFMLAQMAWWRGDLAENERLVREALELARGAGLTDVESEAAQKLASVALARLELEEAQEYVVVACRLAEESGSLIARAQATASRGQYRTLRGELEEAESQLEQARALYEEAGAAWPLARVLNSLADLSERRGDYARAERLLRDAIRILKPLEDRGTLCESQRALAELLVKLGRIEEAERIALEARKTVGPYDQVSRATTRLALARVRAAQGRDAEAEALGREALEIIEATDFISVRVDALRGIAQWLRERGRDEEAEELSRRAAELSPLAATQVLLDEVESAARIA
jgi:tetratricopeptide (TPR) repeat protein